MFEFGYEYHLIQKLSLDNFTQDFFYRKIVDYLN